MKLGAFFGCGLLAVTLLSATAVATPQGVHSEKFPCTQRHTKDPAPSDTLETAPLVMPIGELCASCHEATE